jgi:hypothetical protein
MSMHISSDLNIGKNGVDRKLADAVATRVAKAAHAKALAEWDPRNEYPREAFAARAYAAAYETAFHKAIVKQRTMRINY